MNIESFIKTVEKNMEPFMREKFNLVTIVVQTSNYDMQCE